MKEWTLPDNPHCHYCGSRSIDQLQPADEEHYEHYVVYICPLCRCNHCWNVGAKKPILVGTVDFMGYYPQELKKGDKLYICPRCLMPACSDHFDEMTEYYVWYALSKKENEIPRSFDKNGQHKNI